VGGDLGVLKGAQGGGGPGVQEDGGRSGVRRGDQGAGAGEVLRQLLGQVGEGAQVVTLSDDAAEVVEAEQAVGVAGGRGAVVEAAEGQAVEIRVHVEGGEGGADPVQVQVAEVNALPFDSGGLVVGYQPNAHALDVVQVIVERCRRFGGGVGGEVGLQVVLQRPVAGAATGDNTREHYRATPAGGGADASGGDLRGGGHDHLEGVLHRPGGVEEEDVLGAGAHVHGQDAHGESMIAPSSFTECFPASGSRALRRLRA